MGPLPLQLPWAELYFLDKSQLEDLRQQTEQALLLNSLEEMPETRKELLEKYLDNINRLLE